MNSTILARDVIKLKKNIKPGHNIRVLI